jgi:hypothetical protein
LAIATLLPVLCGFGLAQAGDLCLDGNGLHVLKRFRIPPAGRCRPLSGFYRSGSSRPGITGSACTWSDGSRVDLSFTAMALVNPPPDTELSPRDYFARIDLPSNTGVIYQYQGASSSSGLPAALGPCDPAVVPLP